MRQNYRMPQGGRIDRGKPVEFTFNGRSFHGFQGDTAASALLAHGVHLLGRSFKYHRPRGVLAAGSEEPNALFDVDRGGGRREPNARATGIEIFEGLALRSQNHWPSLAFDVGALTDRLGALLHSGFYYKTFMWPPRAWAKLYEPMIRRMAGLGRAPDGADPDRYAQRHAHTEVLIVGAGPAGLAAALAASEKSQSRVILVDEQAEPGGSLLHDVTSHIDGVSAGRWLEGALATLRSRTNVTLLARTTAFGFYNHNHICLAERLTDHLANPSGRARERLWQVRARRVIIAAGAHERPLVFANNDRPGVVLAEAVRTYINRYAVAPGGQIVVATNGASAYQTALDAKAAGVSVRIVDSRTEGACGAELGIARRVGIDVRTDHVVLDVRGVARVTGIVVARAHEDNSADAVDLLPCDCVAMSGGWTPAVHLFSQSRGRLHFDVDRDAFVPATSAQAETSVGACRGVYTLEDCLADGAAAGGAAHPYRASETYTGFKPVRAGNLKKVKAFVDFQNDVTAQDIGHAVAEGFRSVEHVKRYTTAGMATDQGKTSNLNTLGIAARALGRILPQVGLTTFRPPYTPVSFGTLAGSNRGNLFDPVRVTPLHAACVAAGAVFEDVGLWKRAHYFPRRGEDMPAAVRRECRAVRGAAGLFDASTLGKIEVQGPDAVEFLNRIYTNGWDTLVPGRCRYGLMLKEDGFILDDGVVARLSDTRFQLTTTTGGASRVLAHMEDYLQTEWPELRVFLNAVTEQSAVLALQGPRARAILATLVDGIDLSQSAFPHMAWREGRVAGITARVLRVSFTGEVGYEINVAADFALHVWNALMQRGAPLGLVPYGTEAMHVLRAEKGYIIVGQETDGTMTPHDVGLDGLIAKKKRDFVGKRSLARPALIGHGRKQLVGLAPSKSGEVLDEGAQIVETPDQPTPMRMLGHVTSSYYSAVLGRSIALAVVADGRARMGAELHVTTASGFTTATVVSPVFYDPEGARLHE